MRRYNNLLSIQELLTRNTELLVRLLKESDGEDDPLFSRTEVLGIIEYNNKKVSEISELLAQGGNVDDIQKGQYVTELHGKYSSLIRDIMLRLFVEAAFAAYRG